MGVEPFLVSSTVEGVMAQRLLRRACPTCSTRRHVAPEELPEGFGPPPADGLVEAAGCRECRQTGYRGRMGIYELLRFTDRTRELVMHRANAGRIADAAAEDGDLLRLREDAYAKVREGVTTLAEALRTIQG
jgi:general secretion pathway protein E/type IV pilus assembly protein PilB